jgi:predicted RNase H-like HicB family nuclease
MANTLQYMIVIEKSETSYGAYVPDLPGCIAVGETRDEALDLIKEAIEFHLEGLCEQGEAIPQPCSSGEFIEVSAA